MVGGHGWFALACLHLERNSVCIAAATFNQCGSRARAEVPGKQKQQ